MKYIKQLLIRYSKKNSAGSSNTIGRGDCLIGFTGPRDRFIYSNRYMSSLYRRQQSLRKFLSMTPVLSGIMILEESHY